MNLIDKLRRQNAELKLATMFGGMPAWVISETVLDMQKVVEEMLLFHTLLTGDQEYSDHIRERWYMATGKNLYPEEISDIEKYLDYLDELRESGVTNMFDSPRYLMENFPEIRRVHLARAIFWYWKATFPRRSNDANADDVRLDEEDVEGNNP